MALYMKKSFFPGTTGVFCLFFIPYMITIIFNGVDTTLINRKFDVETILPVIVAEQIGDNYELETIKAQAVIARSNLYRTVKEQKSLNSVLNQIRDEIKNKSLKSLYLLIMQDKYERAVKETKGKVITWENKLKLVPYHEVSSGKTRDGEEVFHSAEYAYLKSVDSSQDKESPAYVNSTYVAASQLPAKLVIKKRDSAGYITALTADGSWIEGETFRQGMHLASADFSVQKVGKMVRFLCKGKGHGLGFSQYGGNEMAKEGGRWEEILAAYFPEMEVTEVESLK